MPSILQEINLIAQLARGRTDEEDNNIYNYTDEEQQKVYKKLENLGRQIKENSKRKQKQN